MSKMLDTAAEALEGAERAAAVARVRALLACVVELGGVPGTQGPSHAELVEAARGDDSAAEGSPAVVLRMIGTAGVSVAVGEATARGLLVRARRGLEVTARGMGLVRVGEVRLPTLEESERWTWCPGCSAPVDRTRGYDNERCPRCAASSALAVPTRDFFCPMHGHNGTLAAAPGVVCKCPGGPRG